MFKRTFLATAVGTALLLGAAVSANALTITSGNYKITLDNYDSGTTYGTTPGILCSDAAACNAVPHTQAPGTTNDTSGIFSIASISNLSTGQTEYLRGVAGDVGGVAVGPYLTGVFYGLQDQYVQTLGNFTQTNSVGGFFNIYNNTADYDPTLGPLGAGVDLNTGTYAGITGGTLFLSGIFAPGAIIAGDNTSSYTSAFNNTSIAGSGQGFLDFTGGAAYNFFNTNSVTNANNGKNDAFITITYDDVNGVASSLGWTVKSVAQVSGEIPEPGTIALLSLAMLGLGAVARRRNQQG